MKLSSYKLSYLIHIFLWMIIWICSIFSKAIAQGTILFVMFGSISVSFTFLAWVTGATDPLYTSSDGTQIPNEAWTIWCLFWIFSPLFILITAIFKYKKGNPKLLKVIVHVPIFLCCLIIQAFITHFFFPINLN